MTTETTSPTATEAPMPVIPMVPVVSNQLAAVGYSPELKVLAITFTRGSGTVYHYPGIEPQQHADLIAAKSIGRHFGEHVKHLPFKKYEPAKAEKTEA
jgi:hypothetical protein